MKIRGVKPRTFFTPSFRPNSSKAGLVLICFLRGRCLAVPRKQTNWKEKGSALSKWLALNGRAEPRLEPAVVREPTCRQLNAQNWLLVRLNEFAPKRSGGKYRGFYVRRSKSALHSVFCFRKFCRQAIRLVRLSRLKCGWLRLGSASHFDSAGRVASMSPPDSRRQARSYHEMSAYP